MEFEKVNPIEPEGSGNGGDSEHTGKKLLPANAQKTKFTSEYQPSGDAKSRGWWKKKKGKHLMQALLNLDFSGDLMDEKTKQIQENNIKNQAAAYFNIPKEFITVEMVMSMKQVAKSIQFGDTGAFNSVMDRAYGKPKEHIEVEEHKTPQIVLNFGKIGLPDAPPTENIDPNDLPPIADDENKIKEE